MRTSYLIFLLVALEVVALGQDSKTAPERRPVSGTSSLDSTLRLIADKINAQGEINYTMISENTRSGGIVEDKYFAKTSNAATDPRFCTLQVDGLLVLNGKTQSQGRGVVRLKDITSVAVKTQSQAIGEQTAKADITEWKGKVVPESYVVQTLQSGSLTGVFFFRDQQTAILVAKNLSRAVELCGGKKDTFPAK
jgi:hypothetical protein